MYSPRVESAHESAGAIDTRLIPMRFVWPYGGKSVFLTGSFIRWSDLLPMSPLEGCPTVFQVICSLIPGYHEYKFFVDGEWRHDEHQPLVSSAYGMVNSVFLSTEAGSIPTVLNSEVPSRSSMDVDNDAFRRLVRIVDYEFHGVVPSISEVDHDVSCNRVSTFLSTHTVYELLPDSGKVIALDIDLPVKQAFHILYEQGISIAPLWDFSKGRFVGILSSLDFILILRELQNHASNLTEEELETHSISAWKEGKVHLKRHIDGCGSTFSGHFIHAGPYDNLKDVSLKILQNGVATLPVIDSASGDGSFPQLLHLASLSEILKCICRNFRNNFSFLPMFQSTIYSIPVGTWIPKIGETNRQPLVMLRPSASLSSALTLLVQSGVSSIPIVDDNMSLLDIFSRRDIIALAKDSAYSKIDVEEMSIHEALQVVQDSSSCNHQRCHMCLRSDSLHKVMECLAIPGVRRLVIVEAGSKRVEGIVSVSDVFRFLLRV